MQMRRALALGDILHCIEVLSRDGVAMNEPRPQPRESTRVSSTRDAMEPPDESAVYGDQQEGNDMVPRLLNAIFASVLIAVPVLADNPTPQSNATNSQGSGAGIHGQPGGKNGPALSAAGTSSDQQTNPTTAQQDTKGIQGMPGSKSGPAVMPPSKKP